MDVRTRPARAADARAIADLWLACTSEVALNEPIYTPGMGSEELARMLAEELSSDKRRGWLAQAGSALAGYVTCRVEEEAPVFVPRKYVYIIDLDVAPPFRRRGVSRILMGEVEAYARGIGVFRLELAFAAADGRARAAWERHGFAAHLVHMHKDIG